MQGKMASALLPFALLHAAQSSQSPPPRPENATCLRDCGHGACDNVTGHCWCQPGWLAPCSDMNDTRCATCSVQGPGVRNGLAQLPPMGWISWQSFGCRIDCTSGGWGDDCLSEGLVKRMADRMVQDGYASVGYSYINIDDCWANHSGRDPATGELVSDPARFPSGMAALSEYVHDSKLRFGLYSAANAHTCAGWPASLGQEERDAATFARWGVDSLKYDGCNANISNYIDSYPRMGAALNKTGRQILFSCSWPVYQRLHGVHPNYQLLQQIGCNLWRNADDMQDDWDSVVKIVEYYATQCFLYNGEQFCDSFMRAQGPETWNDPDMLVLGNGIFSEREEQVQFGMWCLFAAPLYMGNDLRSVPASSRSILQNPELIAVDQDRLGLPATRLRTSYEGGRTVGLELWRREVEPCRGSGMDRQCDVIVVMLNTASVDSGKWGSGQTLPYKLTTTALEVGMQAGGVAALRVRDLFARRDLPQLGPGGNLSAVVGAHSIKMFRLSPLGGDHEVLV
eukprot:SAG31_NODE_59_length_29571_cov_20.443506_23_plen_511_part_00